MFAQQKLKTNYITSTYYGDNMSSVFETGILWNFRSSKSEIRERDVLKHAVLTLF